MDLDQVNISQKAYKQWLERCAGAVECMPSGLDPAVIPDEQCSTQEDGSLLVFVEIPGCRKIEMIIPPGEWTWNH